MSTERARGFTLLELSIAMSLTSIVAISAIATFALVNRYRMRLQLSTIADDNAKVVNQYLVRELQRLGGPTLRPWEAVAVNECDGQLNPLCFAGHSLTMAFLDESVANPICSIADNGLITTSGVDGTITFLAPSITFADGSTASPCCNLVTVDETTGVPNGSLPNEKMHDRNMVVVKDGQHVTLTYASSQPASGCTFDWVVSGQGQPLASGGFNFSTAMTGTAPNATPVTISTVVIGCPDGTPGDCIDNPGRRALIAFSDRNGGAGPNLPMTFDAAFDPKPLIVAPGVIDIRVRGGFDVDADGLISEPSPMEWLSFSAAQTAAIPSTTLRMIEVGVIASMGVHDPTVKSTTQLIGGPSFTLQSTHLRASTGRAAFRGISQLR